VLFRGSQPVFIDLLSFEKRADGDPIWKPYAQFTRTFLLPLLAHQCWGLPLADLFMTHRDGLEPEAAYRLCSPLQRLRPPFLGLVTLPTWLAGRGQAPEAHQERRVANPEKARFILDMTLRRLERALASVGPKPGRASAWSEYMDTHSYSAATFQAKEDFVRQALASAQPRRVLDVGANTGHFSALAAAGGAAVVAIDTDARCAGAIWEKARAQSLDVLPLVVNLARPTPPLGWRNRECAAFLDRARGGFDCVLMLAVLHHLLVTERVPLAEVLELAAELTTDHLVIEWVGPEDAMFRQIARGRDQLHAGLNHLRFEQACQRHFEVARSVRLGESHRWLYWLRKRAAKPGDSA
jgi:SAM-dependent methyltransferase